MPKCKFTCIKIIENLYIVYIFECDYCGYIAEVYRMTSGYGENDVYGNGRICIKPRIPKG